MTQTTVSNTAAMFEVANREGLLAKAIQARKDEAAAKAEAAAERMRVGRIEAAALDLFAALEAVANPNAIDLTRAPLDAKRAALALAWLTARPEFVAARAALAKARGEA